MIIVMSGSTDSQNKELPSEIEERLSQLETEHDSTKWVSYSCILEDDHRDIDRKLLKAGTLVLRNPSQPDVIREDTPANRQVFLKQDKTWTTEAREDIWFPPLSTLSSELKQEVEDCLSFKKNFLDAIDENIIRSAKGTPLPAVSSLPKWFYLLAWEPKIKEVNQEVELTDQLLETLTQECGVPKELNWPSEWRDWLKSLTSMRIYSLRVRSTSVHVISAFIPPLQFEQSHNPAFIALRQQLVNKVLHVYETWNSESSMHPIFKFFTIGSMSKSLDQKMASSAGDHWTVVSFYANDGTINTIKPPPSIDRLSLCNFLDLICPETRQQRISKIRQVVDNKLIGIGYPGNFSVDDIKKQTGYRRALIQDALLQFQETGHYRVYRQGEMNKICVCLPEAKHVPQTAHTVSSAYFRQTFALRYLAYLSPLVGVSIWFAKDVILGKPFEAFGLIAIVPLAYAGRWVETWLGGQGK